MSAQGAGGGYRTGLDWRWATMHFSMTSEAGLELLGSGCGLLRTDYICDGSSALLLGIC